MSVECVIVKRYARSRLYDVTHARYVSLAQLREWRVNRLAFSVLDGETGADITDVLLA